MKFLTIGFFLFSLNLFAASDRPDLIGDYQLKSTDNAQLCAHDLTVEATEDGQLHLNGIKNIEKRNDWGWWLPEKAPHLIFIAGEFKGEKRVGKIFKSNTKFDGSSVSRKAKMRRFLLWPFSLKVTMSFKHKLSVRKKLSGVYLTYTAYVRTTGTDIIPRVIKCVYRKN